MAFWASTAEAQVSENRQQTANCWIEIWDLVILDRPGENGEGELRPDDLIWAGPESQLAVGKWSY